ncbi:hypothetical protein ACSNOJ_29475 [Streptomyces sp. URMC 128]|uniref:hypothetical protein n=1 Tax=Streptomyces sp. URMC 128 TaxID=3423404 RepID=UPI003F1DC3AD
MGFDTPDPGQLRLRALLALGIFNGGRLQQWPGTWAMASVTHYDLVLSPRADNLVLITPTPSNVLQYLVPRGRPMGLPGLRLEETTADSFLLRHVVIGARMTVTDRPPISPFGGDFDGDRVWNVQQELTAAEQEALADVPPMTDDASVLLSGLMSRIGLRDPWRNWALGNWFMDPLDRTSEWGGGPGRRLWGHGGWWELTWGSFPFRGDVARALTDPQAGIAGADAVQVRRGWDVRLGDAVLALRGEDG